MSADVCRARPFTPNGYVRLLRDGVRVLRAAHEYEDAVDLYKLMLPVFESAEQYAEQAEVHGAIADLCDQIVEEEQAGTRLMPIFYLVSFLGEPFAADSLRDERFIYREPVEFIIVIIFLNWIFKKKQKYLYMYLMIILGV